MKIAKILFFTFIISIFSIGKSFALVSHCDDFEKKILNSQLRGLVIDTIEGEDAEDGAALDVIINNIDTINAKDNTFEVDLELKTTWYIEELYPVIADALFVEGIPAWCSFNREDWEKMQIGTVYTKIDNSIGLNRNLVYENYEVKTSDYIDYLYEETTPYNERYLKVIYKLKGKFLISNPYKLKSFPFDKQTLSIKILEDYRPGGTDLFYDEISEEKLKEFVDNNNILEWKITNSKIDYVENSEKEKLAIKISVDIEREYKYYIYKIIFPIFLILLVCWSIFWVDPLQLESKLTITIVCLLSLIAYNFVIDNDLPKQGYLTIIDYIILLSYLYAGTPNFLTIYCYRLAKAGKKNKANQIDRISRVFGPLSFGFLILLIVITQVAGNPHTVAFLSAFK